MANSISRVFKWAGIVLLVILMGAFFAGATNSSPSSPNVANTDAVQSTAPQLTAAQASSSQETTNQTQANSSSQGGGTGLVRKTTTGVVRLSTVDFNQALGISQQVIIFGGDADAVDDGSGWICVVNGENNFVSAVIGDTVTVTGENAVGTPALISCRVDSLQ
ncbi:MAG: hypothetical protein P4L81_08460 [Candidatus Pacebacteria bacterium]|nr:hypothetical protein [Candidatus Paceibacterota bacterium]